MKQKLIAVAVAGIFAAPAVALAQSSSVQIYGTLNAEYGFAKGVNKAAGKTNTFDGLNSGASNFGFKGEEKLGGGMSAFFQCESDLKFLKGDLDETSGTLCDRNSAVGLKGGFGSAFIGTWDSPTKQLVAGTRMLGETGWHGVQGMLISNGGAFIGSFSTRNTNTLNYSSPKFGGFSFNAQTTSTKAAATVTTAGLKGRANSMSLNYAAGPMALGLAYTKQDDNAKRIDVTGGSDQVLVLGGTYTLGAAKIGLTYVDGKADQSTTGELKRSSWNIAGEYNFGGPHSMFAGYTRAGDTKASGTAVGTAATGSDTGAFEYQIGYRHTLSKRTMVGISYIYADNDDRATGYSVGTNHATGLVAGSSSSVIATQLKHTF